MNPIATKHDYLVRHMVFWIGLTFACFSIAIPFARHFIYALPVLVLLTLLGDRTARIGDEAKPFLAFVIAGIVLSPFATDEGMKDLYFTFTGVSIALLIDIPHVKLWNIFIVLFVSMVIYFGLFGDFKAGLQFDFAHSSSSFESSFSFMFGLLAPFALMEKRFRLFALCLILTVLSLKRIAIIGTVCASIFILMGQNRARVFLNPVAMIGLNVLLLFGVLLYGFGAFDSLILQFTGQSSNQFGMGRKALLSLPANEVFSHPEHFIFFGQGPGATYKLANQGFGAYGTAQRLHSDILKIFYEYGLVFYCVFIGLMYSAKRFSTRVAFLYMNVLFLSDNTLIYSFIIFFFVALARHMESDQRTPTAFPSVMQPQ